MNKTILCRRVGSVLCFCVKVERSWTDPDCVKIFLSCASVLPEMLALEACADLETQTRNEMLKRWNTPALSQCGFSGFTILCGLCEIKWLQRVVEQGKKSGLNIKTVRDRRKYSESCSINSQGQDKLQKTKDLQCSFYSALIFCKDWMTTVMYTVC